MNFKKMLSVPLLLMVVSGLFGCSSVPMGDVQRDGELKKFAVPAGKAGIYVYRNENFGAAITMHVDVDGVPLGKTAAKTYLYKEVNPGKHTVTSSAENTDTIEIDVKQDTLNFIWQEVKMGLFTARTKLQQVTEAVGKAGVLESNLAQSR